MNINLSKIINNNNKNFKLLEINEPLLVVNYSPLKISVEGETLKDVLIDIYFQTEDKRIFKAYDLQLETTSIFPLNSVFFKNTIESLGTDEIFPLNPEKIKYDQWRYLNLPNSIKNSIKNLLLIEHDQEYFGVYKYQDKIIIFPSSIIGSFFYFPNSAIRRAFFKQDIYVVLHKKLSDCKTGHLCLKNNVKFNEKTVALSYLYLCKRFSQSYFYHAFSFFIKEKVKKIISSKRKKDISFPKFKFPVNVDFNIIFRGKWISEKYFLALEIRDVDFGNIFNINNLSYSYKQKGRQIEGNVKFTKMYEGSRSSTISHTKPFNPNLKEKDINVNIKTHQENFVNRLNIFKEEPIDSKELRNKSISSREKFENYKGNSLSEQVNKSSEFSKGNILKIEFKFLEIIEKLKRKLKLNSELCFFKDTSDCYSFSFKYKGRNYLLLELKKYQASSLLFSSKEKIDENYIIFNVILMKKKGKSSYKTFGEELYNHNICFHIPQKHAGKSIDDWIDRLVKKVNEPHICKGKTK